MTKNHLVRRNDLIMACGPIAGQLKSYQLVGINFLMMLHKNEKCVHVCHGWKSSWQYMHAHVRVRMYVDVRMYDWI